MLSLRTMKWVDSYVGQPLCLLFGVLARLKRRGPLSYPAEVRKVLVIKFWGMGSIVLAAPALEKLKKKYPGCRIFFLTFDGNRDICRMIPSIDEILTIRIDSNMATFIRDTLSILHRVRREKFDFVADLEFFTRFSALITFLTRARVKAGFHAWETYRGNLHDIRIPFNYYWHVSDNFVNLAIAGDPSEGERVLPRLVVPHDSEVWVSQFLTTKGVSPRELLVVLNPNAGELALERRWPRETFARLIRILEDRYAARLFLIGSKSEREYNADILREAGTVKADNLAGGLSIVRLAALFLRANLVITNDSGPLHIACAVGTPTISFFGPETPVLYGPQGDGHHVFFRNISCSPCINVHNTKTVRCRRGHPECLARITVEDVLDAVEACLKQSSAVGVSGRRQPGDSLEEGQRS
ncbi:MAG: glycosyltransferase family 9 protein [Candidatus Abyssubacteria bacterium]